MNNSTSGAEELNNIFRDMELRRLFKKLEQEKKEINHLVRFTGPEPTRGSDGAAGYDITANEDAIIAPNKAVLVKTGLKIALNTGYYAQLKSRSGIAYKHQVYVQAGVIDEDYRGEIGVILHNFGDKEFVVKKNDRIAQMIILKYEVVNFVKSDLNATDRGAGGFGSTGV